MPRDNFMLTNLANEIAKCVRRDPEYRKPPNDPVGRPPFKLVGIIDGHAVIRRPAAVLATYPLKVFDTWQETDKDGNPLHAD
jgi:adenylate kinase